MSAYICDPSTIDYLVTWARNQRDLTAYVADRLPATEYDHVRDGRRFDLRKLTPNELGQILLTENVRSVTTRYPNDSADTLPGPINQARVWRYTFSSVRHQLPAWVIKACDCLRYQSCETDDYEQTLAYAVLQAIRESAIDHLIVNAPWGATSEDVAKHTAEIRERNTLTA